MSLILSILGISLIGILFTLYKARVRIEPEKGPLTKEPETHHPIAHIKSVLFLEIPLERIAMGGFTLILISYGWILISETTFPEFELGLLTLASVMMLLLLFKQILVAGISDSFRWRVMLLLVISALLTLLIWNRPEIMEPALLEEAGIYMLTLHILGLVLGLGGAVILDVMIFHFLNNFKISSREAVIMHLISQMIILGLIFLIVSGAALTLADPDRFLENPRFLMKMTGVGVVTLNGILLNLFVVPKMEQISFLEGDKESSSGLISAAFIAGSVSMVSWFTVFILAMINPLEAFSYLQLLTAYLILLVVTIAGALGTKKLYEVKGERA